MPELTPEAIVRAFVSAWDEVGDWLEGDADARVSGSQAEVAERLTSGLARQLAVPSTAGRRAGIGHVGRVWVDQGDPDLARPARIWLATGKELNVELARVRWLPRSIYRALGFVVHTRRDVRELSSAARGCSAPYQRWVCLVDVVGVVDQHTVDELASIGTFVGVRAWSARHGGLLSTDRHRER